MTEIKYVEIGEKRGSILNEAALYEAWCGAVTRSNESQQFS